MVGADETGARVGENVAGVGRRVGGVLGSLLVGSWDGAGVDGGTEGMSVSRAGDGRSVGVSVSRTGLVGPRVGVSVSRAVADGFRVGPRVDGLRVGPRVDGFRVGPRVDGLRVGFSVSRVGSAGARVGASVSPAGASVGASVSPAGATVGLSVSRRVGSQDGEACGRKVGAGSEGRGVGGAFGRALGEGVGLDALPTQPHPSGMARWSHRALSTVSASQQ